MTTEFGKVSLYYKLSKFRYEINYHRMIQLVEDIPAITSVS